MKNQLFALILILSLGSASAAEGASPLFAEKYKFIAHTKNNVQAGIGYLCFLAETEIIVAGKWKITWNKTIVQSNDVGFFSLNDGGRELYINLHPSIKDANIFLAIGEDGIETTGEWTWNLFEGVASKGDFRLLRAKNNDGC